MAQPAYDLEMFEDRRPQKEPRVRAIKGKKPSAQLRGRRVKQAALVVLMITLVCGLISSQVMLTELTGQIQSTKQQLVNAQSDYNYLASVLDSKTSQKNVEEIAITQLGLMKLDRSQITYFSLENDATIQRPESAVERLTEFLTTSVLSLADYLNP